MTGYLGAKPTSATAGDPSINAAIEKFTYCPSANTTDTTTGYLNAFIYNPWMAKYDYSGTYYDHPWWFKASKFGKAPKGAVKAMDGLGAVINDYQFDSRRRALAIDPMQGNKLTFATHYQKNQRAYNILFIDGSVETAIFDPSIQRVDNIDKWARLLDYVGYAEATVAGTPNGGKTPAWNKLNTVPIFPGR